MKCVDYFLHHCIQKLGRFLAIFAEQPINFVWEEFVFTPTVLYIVQLLKKYTAILVSYASEMCGLYRFIWKLWRFLLPTCTYCHWENCVRCNCSLQHSFDKSTLLAPGRLAMQMKCKGYSSIALSESQGNFCCSPVYLPLGEFVFTITAQYIVYLLKVHCHSVSLDNH